MEHDLNEPDTQPEHDAPTEPAPAPASTIPPVLAPQPATDLQRWQDAERTKLRGAHWLDWGKDTGPRLRVREWVSDDIAFPLVEPEPTHDPKEVDELNAVSRKALAEGDDRTLGRLYEDLLDDIHTSDAGQGALEAQLVQAAQELQEEITAELREVARAEKNWGWKHTLSEYGIRVRARTPQGEQFECQIDRRGTKALIMWAIEEPRAAASSCVRDAREQIHQARARHMIGGFVPVQNEVGQA